jgi:hypothetical protein
LDTAKVFWKQDVDDLVRRTDLEEETIVMRILKNLTVKSILLTTQQKKVIIKGFMSEENY